MLKNKTKALILALFIGGTMMTTACATETKTVSLSFPIENKEELAVQRAVELNVRDFDIGDGVYNPRLASMCAVMAASASESKSPQENLYEMGFSHIAKFSYEDYYEEDRVGVVMGSKNIGPDMLIFLTVRGTRGREWYSNFDVGYGKEHKGFSQCADFLQKKTEQYITNYALDRDHLRFLVTGYSRGAAAANIFSKRLIDEYTEERVAAYTFASPNTTTEENPDQYRAIYNIVKADDVFTQIPLSKWGYHRYGTDIELDESDESSKDEVRQVFRSVTGDEFRGFDSETEVQSFVRNAYRLAPGIYDYYQKRYTVGDKTLTMYEYMTLAAKFLCEENDEEDADTLTETLLSDFSDISLFFLSGMDMEDLLLTGDFYKSGVADSHSMVGYMTLMDGDTPLKVFKEGEGVSADERVTVLANSR